MSAGFFVSKTLDRFGLFNTLIFSVCIQALCVISMFVYFNPINFVICHFIMGLTGGMNWMTMDTWVNIVSNNNNRGKSIGLYNSAGQLLATAHLSKPIVKNFASETTIKVKLTY